VVDDGERDGELEQEDEKQRKEDSKVKKEIFHNIILKHNGS